jgi:hypothetical protein
MSSCGYLYKCVFVILCAVLLHRFRLLADPAREWADGERYS